MHLKTFAVGIFFSMLLSTLFINVDIYGLSSVNKSQKISDTLENSYSPAISVSKNNIFIVWLDSSENNNTNVLLKRSIDNGSTFGSIEKISSGNGSSSLPQIHTFDNNVYISWIEKINNISNIYLRVSNDFGNSFGPITDISHNINGNISSYDIKAKDGNVYLVWDDDSLGSEGIRFKSSYDNGQKFEVSKYLSTKGEKSPLEPTISLDANNVNVIWKDTKDTSTSINPQFNGSTLFYKKSNDLGRNFSDTDLINRGTSELQQPKIVSSDNLVYILWVDSGKTLSQDILYKVSENGGSNFTTVKSIVRSPGDSISPDASIFGKDLYVVWRDTKVSLGNLSNSEWDIRFKSIPSSNSNSTSLVKTLSKNIGHFADFPRISITNSSIDVIWSDLSRSNDNNTDLFYTSSDNLGITFSDPINLSTTIGKSTNPVLFSTDDYTYVVWEEINENSKAIFFRSITK